MRVAFGCARLAMPQNLADEIQAVPSRYRDRGEAMSKVMDANIVEPGCCSDTLPRFLNADKMSDAAFGRKNELAVFVMRQIGQQTERWCSEGHSFAAGFAVRKKQTTALKIDPFPAEGKDL